jgi:hypothetical protein
MSKLKVDILANSADSASTPIADVINGSARAWVVFNGSGTPAVIAAYNVSSIVDITTAEFGINFTTAMPDANYAVSGSARGSTGGNNGVAVTPMDTPTASRVDVGIRQISPTAVIDSTRICVIIHR